MSKRIEQKIRKLYNQVFEEVFTEDRLSQLQTGNSSAVMNFITEFQASKKYNEFAKKFSKELTKAGLSSRRGIWRKYYEAARSAHYIALPKTFTAFEAQTYKVAIQNNFTMIKSIPQKIIQLMNHKYVSTLIEEVAKGALPRGSFKKELSKHGHKNAGVIARTESAKLQTIILESRATDLGSVAYMWLASNDKRTRQSHKEMNGVIVFWKFAKPLLDNMEGHAGEFPNCRCSPQPIFDEDDLTKSTYKVYDYRIHKIITMSKKELVIALQNGHL